MKVIELAQNTKDWRAWRDKGLGASCAPVIMGVSPWTTPFQLWLETTNLCERPPANEFALAAMKRGTELEPLARIKAETQLGRPYAALCAEHDDHSFIRASFDGVNVENRSLIEIKCPGKADHAKALKGTIPEKYYPQLQQQFLVSGYEHGFYCSWDGKDASDVVIVPIKRDDSYIADLLVKLQKFWTRVEMQIPPEVTPLDAKNAVARVVAEEKRLTAAVKVLQLTLGG